MGFLTEPSVQQVDPNPQSVQGLQGDISSFLQGELQNPGQTFGSFTSPLQRQATGGISQFLSQPSPEMQTLQSAQPALLGMLNQGAQGMGAFDQSQALVGAATPIFDRNLQSSLGALGNQAAGRFSTAFGAQANDLTSRALQDFNLFSQQALQSGLGLDLQSRQIGQQGALGAANLLGSLSAQAGQNPFNRALQAGQLGLGQTQAAINPTLQLLLGGMGFGQPQALDSVVGESPLTQFGNLGIAAATAAAMSSIKVKEDVTPSDAEADLEDVRGMNIYSYRYIGARPRRSGLILEDPTTPEELKYGEGIDIYSFAAKLASAVQALSAKVERLEGRS